MPENRRRSPGIHADGGAECAARRRILQIAPHRHAARITLRGEILPFDFVGGEVPAFESPRRFVVGGHYHQRNAAVEINGFVVFCC